MMRRLTLVTVVTGILVALGVTVAQATTISPLTIPSGTEVIPHIAYDLNSGASSIKLYDPATSKDETISSTEGTDSFLWQPQLSEDGTKVLFLDYHDYAYDPDTGIDTRQESIGFAPSDGGERVRIVTGQGIGEYDLSRDGSKVLYQAFLPDDGEVHLFTAPVEGNATPTEVPVPSNFPQVIDPIFNKDGTGIFFNGYDQDDPSLTSGQLYYMNLDGTGVKKLTDFTTVYDPETSYTGTPAGWNPQGKELSPDGDTIVYYGFLATDGTDYHTGIYTLPVSGGIPKEVAVPSPGEADLYFPHYNHDGTRIMFSQRGPNPSEDPDAGSGPNNLYSVPTAGGGDRQLLAEGIEDPGNWETVNYTIPAPSVTSISPADGAVNVAKTTHPKATFDQQLDQTTLNTDNVKLEVYNDTRKKWVAVSTNAPTYDQDSKTITVNPSTDLGSQKRYRVILSTGIKSVSGTALEQPYIWSFMTRK